MSDLSVEPRALIFTGVLGSGKTFTADQVLLKMFQTARKSDWLQNLRKVGSLQYYNSPSLLPLVHVVCAVLASVISRTEGSGNSYYHCQQGCFTHCECVCVCVCVCASIFDDCLFPGEDGRLCVHWSDHNQGEDKLLLLGPGKLLWWLVAHSQCLLVQTRVVNTRQNEQNFHVFYQLLAGLTSEERSECVRPCLCMCVSVSGPKCVHVCMCVCVRV